MSLVLLDKLIEKIILENTVNLQPQTSDDVTDNLLLNLVKPTEIGLGAKGGASFDAKFFQELAPSLTAPLNTDFLTEVMKSINDSMSPSRGTDLKQNFKSLFYATQMYSLFQDWDESSLGFLMESLFAPIIRKQGGKSFRPDAGTGFGADFVYGNVGNFIGVNYKTVQAKKSTSAYNDVMYDHGIPYLQFQNSPPKRNAPYKVFKDRKGKAYLIKSSESLPWTLMQDRVKYLTNYAGDDIDSKTLKDINASGSNVQAMSKETTGEWLILREPKNIMPFAVSFFIKKVKVAKDEIILQHSVSPMLTNNILGINGKSMEQYLDDVFASSITKVTNLKLILPKNKAKLREDKPLGEIKGLQVIPLGEVLVLDNLKFRDFYTSTAKTYKQPARLSDLGGRIEVKLSSSPQTTRISLAQIENQVKSLGKTVQGNFFVDFEAWMYQLAELLTKFLANYDKASTVNLDKHFKENFKQFDDMLGTSENIAESAHSATLRDFEKGADPTKKDPKDAQKDISLDLEFNKIFSLYDPANPQRKVKGDKMFNNFISQLKTANQSTLDEAITTLIQKMNNIVEQAKEKGGSIDSQFLSGIAVLNTFDYVFRNFGTSPRGFSLEKVIGAIFGGVEIPATEANGQNRVDDNIFTNMKLGVGLKSTAVTEKTKPHGKASALRNYLGTFNIPLNATTTGKPGRADKYRSSNVTYKKIRGVGYVADLSTYAAAFQTVEKYQYLEVIKQPSEDNEFKLQFDYLKADVPISKTQYNQNIKNFKDNFVVDGEKVTVKPNKLKSQNFEFDFNDFRENLSANHEEFYKFIKSIESWYIGLVYRISQYMKTFDLVEAKKIVNHLNDTDWRDNPIFQSKLKQESLDNLIESIIKQKLLK